MQVKRDFICLYCNDRCQPFQSLEAVRKHMDAKGHCKVRYGDGGDDEDADLEDFYDYSSRFLLRVSSYNSSILLVFIIMFEC
jgi:pre-60S factor REI1